jgi:glucose 1-dehydrogenase
MEAPKLLKGQKALVTGAHSGIGRAVAVSRGKAGADVAVNYVAGEDSAKETCDEIKAFGGDAIPIHGDVSNEERVRAMFQTMFDRFETIEILVNNAGLQRATAIEHMTLAQWNTVMSVNLAGQFLCSREVIREFGRRGVAGT